MGSGSNISLLAIWAVFGNDAQYVCPMIVPYRPSIAFLPPLQFVVLNYNKQHVESKKSYFYTRPPKTKKIQPNSDHGNPWHANPSGKLFPNLPRGGVTIHELQVRRPVRDSNIACARWVETARAPWVMQCSNEAVSPEWNVPLKDVKWAAGWHGVDDTWPSMNMLKNHVNHRFQSETLVFF